MSDITRKFQSLSASIASGQTASGAIAVADFSFGSFVIPASFTGTAISFTGCDTADGTFVSLYDSTNTIISKTVAVSRAYPLPPEVFGFKFVKLVSGSAEGGDRSITVTLKG